LPEATRIGSANARGERRRSCACKTRSPDNGGSRTPAFAGEQGQKADLQDQRDYDLLPGRIEEIEAVIARDEAALSDPDLYAREPKRFTQLTAAVERARAERDAAEERWLELAEQVEALQG
jgi:ATP-binding cassette subfamily F protein uup